MPNASLILSAIALAVFAGFWQGFARADEARLPPATVPLELVQG